MKVFCVMTRFFFFQAEDGIRDLTVTGVQTCALPISETLTDQNPAGGWVNNTGSSFTGQENGDECAWISSGQGAAALVAFSTGSFAMQSTWSNDTNRCDISHPIVSGSGGGGGTPTANFTYSASGLTVSFTDTSTDSGGTIGSHAWNFGDGV